MSKKQKTEKTEKTETDGKVSPHGKTAREYAEAVAAAKG